MLQLGGAVLNETIAIASLPNDCKGFAHSHCKVSGLRWFYYARSARVRLLIKMVLPRIARERASVMGLRMRMPHLEGA